MSRGHRRSHSGSRSRSRSRDRKRRKDEKLNKMQSQMDNLTQTVVTLTQSIQTLQNKIVTDKNAVTKNSENETPEVTDATLHRNDGENGSTSTNDKTPESVAAENSKAEQVSTKDSVNKILGMDQECTYKEVKYVTELNDTWSQWMLKGLPEKNKKDILEAYNRKGTFYSESPKLNLELGPLLTDIAKKRDQHFADTQNCVGTALSALGAAVSLLVEPPEEGLDEELFTEYLSHAGQILADVFYQQSVARKSFITPQLNKNIKPLVETMLSKDWLYGDDLMDKVKDMKEIEKACADMKEKPPARINTKPRDPGNGKYPPASSRQLNE